MCAPEAAWIADEYPHDSVEEDPNGTLIVTLPVSDMTWLTRLLLRMGSSVSVVDQPEVTSLVVSAARAALDRYEAR